VIEQPKKQSFFLLNHIKDYRATICSEQKQVQLTDQDCGYVRE